MLSLALTIVGVAVCAATGVFVFLQDRNNTRNKLFAVLSASFVAIIFCNYFTLVPSDNFLNFIRTVVAATTIGTASLLLLMIDLSSEIIKVRKRKLSEIVIAVTAIVVVLCFTPFVFQGLNSAGNAPVAGWGIVMFVGHFIISVLASVFLLLRGVMYSRHVTIKSQYRVILIGLIPILMLVPITSVVLPIVFNNTSFIAITPLYVAFLLTMMGYAIVRHGLFDIRAAAMRTAAYTLSIITLGVIYFFLAYVASITVFKDRVTTGISVSPINIALALVLAFIFQPIKSFFDKVTDKIFFRNQYDSEEFYSRLGELLITSFDLRDLLQKASNEISLTLKAEQAIFYIAYNQTKHVEAGTANHSKLATSEWGAIEDTFDSRDSIVTVVETDEMPRGLKAIMKKHKIAIVMKLAHDQDVLGYMLLGDQRSRGYSMRDIRVLETISDELVIAIMNALSLQEVRDLNVNLQERINDATKELLRSNRKLTKLDETKDEFISMASHQLRTPLTSVKGYISMVLDGDAGDISKEQQQLLQQAFESSQRMVYLIGDFLNVSRLRTGKFVLEPSEVNLAQVIKEEVIQLTDSAKARGITIHYDKPSTMPSMIADESKLRQVMMNFMDNAMYYTLPGGDIKVELYKNHMGIVFKVIDSGIGVPKIEQSKLFTKFFRAPNARKQRPDGTGIGLYMAKKVIVAHGGSIIFESREGKGSTFGFRLPLVIDSRRFDKIEEEDSPAEPNK